MHNFILASVRIAPGIVRPAPSIAVWFVDVSRSMPNATTKTLTKRLDIPFKKSLHQELLYMHNFILASVRSAPGIFRPAPSVAVF
jgi:hypothetical protein